MTDLIPEGEVVVFATPQQPRTAAGRAFYLAYHWMLHAPLRGCVLPCSVLQKVLDIEDEAAALRRALVSVITEFDYWASEPRPAVGGGTVRIHKFLDVQPSMERALDEARAALAQQQPTVAWLADILHRAPAYVHVGRDCHDDHMAAARSLLGER